MPIPRMVIIACCFAFAAFGTRFVLRHVESRWQIAAFCLAAFAYEFLVPGEQPRSFGKALILSGVCMASVLAVKLATEPDVIPVAVWTAKAELKQIKQRARDAVRRPRQNM